MTRSRRAVLGVEVGVFADLVEDALDGVSVLVRPPRTGRVVFFRN
jgi:hypothetical protein